MTNDKSFPASAGLLPFDSLADSWDEIAIHPPERVGAVLSLAGLVEGMRVLDVGCGTGILAPRLSTAVGEAGRVVAIDLSPRMIKTAFEKRSFSNVEYRVSDFYAFDDAEGFSLILVFSAFPHFLDREAFFEKAKRLLIHRGRIVIAHIESRSAINARHETMPFPSQPLPPIAELAGIAEKADFRPLLLRDDDYYILVAERSGL